MALENRGGSLYIAGSSSAVPRPGRANSGYLLRGAECAIAVEFGSGVFGHIRDKIDPVALDAVIVSHMHADHFFDIVPLRYALRYEMHRATPLPVYLPPGGIHVAKTIGSPLKESADFYAGVLDLREYSQDEPLQIGPCTVRVTRTVHYITAYAMRIEMPGRVFGYSGDTAPCDAVPELVRDADIFLCESALGANHVERGPERGHSNARDAGEMATRANVKHLILTHYNANADTAAMQTEASAAFSGDVTIADDGMEFLF